MSQLIAVVLTLVAAFLFGLSSVLEQRSTKQVPDRLPSARRLLPLPPLTLICRLPRVLDLANCLFRRPIIAFSLGQLLGLMIMRGIGRTSYAGGVGRKCLALMILDSFLFHGEVSLSQRSV